MSDRPRHQIVNPASLGAPRGYSNGILTPTGGRMLFIAGQVGWNSEQRLIGEGFIEQFGRALENVVAVVREAGGQPGDLVRLTIYVVDKGEYLDGLRPVGEVYRGVMGHHYPAMSLVEGQALLEPGARVEI